MAMVDALDGREMEEARGLGLVVEGLEVVDLGLLTFFVVVDAVPDGRGGLNGLGGILGEGWNCVRML